MHSSRMCTARTLTVGGGWRSWSGGVERLMNIFIRILGEKLILLILSDAFELGVNIANFVY